MFNSTIPQRAAHKVAAVKPLACALLTLVIVAGVLLAVALPRTHPRRRSNTNVAGSSECEFRHGF